MITLSGNDQAAQTYTRRRERHRLSGPVVTLVLMTVGVLGLITIVSVSAGSHAPPARDLAPVAAMPVPPMPPASVDAVEGQGPRLGHLLPTVQLSSGGREVRSTDIRPAVVALLPADCDCAEVVRAVRHQARSYGIDVWVVGSGSLTEQVQRLRRLDAQVGSGTTRWAVDESSVLSRALAGNGLTIAFVGDDGVVQAIDRDMPVTAPGLPYLGRQLAVLVTPDRT